MNDLQKYLSKSLLATAALLVGASPALAQQVSLGTASAFSVLGTAVTTSASTINGDVGSAGAVTLTGTAINGNLVYSGVLTNAGSTISGTSTQPLPAQVITDLNSAWTSVQSIPCTDTTTLAGATITGPKTLVPGVYCNSTAAGLTGAGVLTLDARGNSNAVWVFKIAASLTGTGFSVVMANGGQPCNVFWVPGADVTMTTSAFSGNILAAANGANFPAGGSITLTGGILAGRALANVAVTMTGANIIGCSALPVPPSSCKDEDRDHDGHDKDHGKCDDGHDGDKGHSKCNDGKDDDKGHRSDAIYPLWSNDNNGGSKSGSKSDGKSGKW